jgi:hypothetical protein
MIISGITRKAMPRGWSKPKKLLFLNPNRYEKITFENSGGV